MLILLKVEETVNFTLIHIHTFSVTYLIQSIVCITCSMSCSEWKISSSVVVLSCGSHCRVLFCSSPSLFPSERDKTTRQPWPHNSFTIVLSQQELGRLPVPQQRYATDDESCLETDQESYIRTDDEDGGNTEWEEAMQRWVNR